MSDIEDMLVADVRSLEKSLSKERLASWNWQQSAETQKARAEALAGLLREVRAECPGHQGVVWMRIDAALGDK